MFVCVCVTPLFFSVLFYCVGLVFVYTNQPRNGIYSRFRMYAVVYEHMYTRIYLHISYISYIIITYLFIQNKGGQTVLCFALFLSATLSFSLCLTRPYSTNSAVLMNYVNQTPHTHMVSNDYIVLVKRKIGGGNRAANKIIKTRNYRYNWCNSCVKDLLFITSKLPNADESV